jgi:dTDP-4-amino-4,6-dideoxygalactose transaminase
MGSFDPLMSSERLLSRRDFGRATALGAAAVTLGGGFVSANDKPAILGGTPVAKTSWPGWPVIGEGERQGVAKVLESGHWYRYSGGKGAVDEFEAAWAKALGVPHCQATSSGTTSLITAFASLEIGPGDEVLVPPYTFIATVNAVMVHHALPVFVDSDPATAQIDPSKIAEKVNGETRCVVPVHLGGASCDMDQLLQIAKDKKLDVVEDSCQTHTGEWKGKRLGGFGDAGCYSFQNSKNITSGEGGAMVTPRADVYARANAYQNQGGGKLPTDGKFTSGGGNFRLKNFQGAILSEQLKRLDEQSRIREGNADYLSKLMQEVGGVGAKKKLAGTTRHGYHLFVFDYDPEQFAGMKKTTFLKALSAEGIPAAGGYTALNKGPWVEKMLGSRGFRRVYGDARLKKWRDENVLAGNDRMIENTCWLTQNVLLADRSQMDRIADALKRIKQHATAIAKA